MEQGKIDTALKVAEQIIIAKNRRLYAENILEALGRGWSTKRILIDIGDEDDIVINDVLAPQAITEMIKGYFEKEAEAAGYEVLALVNGDSAALEAREAHIKGLEHLRAADAAQIERLEKIIESQKLQAKQLRGELNAAKGGAE